MLFVSNANWLISTNRNSYGTERNTEFSAWRMNELQGIPKVKITTNI